MAMKAAALTAVLLSLVVAGAPQSLRALMAELLPCAN